MPLKLTREQTAGALNRLGYSVNYHWQFAARDERTPSAFINQNGTIHDFGSGWHGDLADFLAEFKGFSIREALEKAREFGNITFDPSEFKDFRKSAAAPNKKRDFIPNGFVEHYANERRMNFDRYIGLLKKLLPSVNDCQKRKRIALKYEIGYSKQADRLIMPIRDENGRIVTFWKYNPELKIKVAFTKDRERGAFNTKDLLGYSKNLRDQIVWVLEGEKDVLNAIANGFHAVTPGGAGCVFLDRHLPLFKGLKVVIAGDNDEAGKNFNERVKARLKDYAQEIKTLDWQELFGHSPSIGESLSKGFDMTDLLLMENGGALLRAAISKP